MQTDGIGKAHKNCTIGQTFCLHHITGTAFIIRLKVYAYIVDNSDTFQKIYSFIHFKGALYIIYKVRIICRRFPAKFSAIVSPAVVMHDSVHRRDLRGSG